MLICSRDEVPLEMEKTDAHYLSVPSVIKLEIKPKDVSIQKKPLMLLSSNQVLSKVDGILNVI